MLLLVEPISNIEVFFVTVEQYRLSLAWSASELARRAGLNVQTVLRVERGEPVYSHTVAAIARAFSAALGRTITVDDIDGANIINK